MKLFHKVAIGASTFAAGIASTFAAPYTIESTDVTALGTVATDVADSVIGLMMSVLPVAIPLLVVGFIISFVMGLVRRR